MWARLVLPGLILLSWPAVLPVHGQVQGSGPEWNEPRVLELVRRARTVRREPVTDTALESYQADARGYVYFFLDRADREERTLVKADQVALEVYWKAPDHTRQRIVGLRDEKVLPTDIHYHLDHLTVVQDDFGDWITMGDGDEVSRVLHPVGPGAQGIYDFRLADSLTLRYGGEGEEVRVYEVAVRPKAPDMPGVVGSIFLDRDRAAIVRMGFTFTRASYVDPYLDYIRVSLDNALWLGRYWLPYRQEVELRRELPLLDFMAGSVIRGRFEIRNYEFNAVHDRVLALRPIAAVPEPERRAFPFERGLYDDLAEEGLAPAPELEDIREQARRLVREGALSGLRPLRLHLPSVSDGLRYNRAEGLFAGGGVALAPAPDVALRLAAGWAVAREAATASATLTDRRGPVVPEIALYWDGLRDLGPVPGAAPTLNSLATATFGEDWLDPWHARGVRLTLRGARPESAPEVTLLWEDHRAAINRIGGDVRPVRPVQEGILGAAAVRLPLPLPLGATGAGTARLGRMGEETFATLGFEGSWSLERPDRPWTLQVEGRGGLTTDGAPVQERFHLGGRRTLGGHDYRSLTGRAFWLLRGVLTRPLAPPWLGLRAVAAAGGTHRGTGTLPAGWPQQETGVRGSLGLGLALGWDVLHLDLLHGLGPGGGWEVVFSVRPGFHPWL
jgi:hypothetical protein